MPEKDDLGIGEDCPNHEHRFEIWLDGASSKPNNFMRKCVGSNFCNDLEESEEAPTAEELRSAIQRKIFEDSGTKV